MSVEAAVEPGQEALADAGRPAPPCTIVIFGAAGDLTKRKLVPDESAVDLQTSEISTLPSARAGNRSCPGLPTRNCARSRRDHDPAMLARMCSQ